MAELITTSAAIGYGVSVLGWLASPIISRLLNEGFTHLNYNATERLKDLDIQILQLQRVMEVVDGNTYKGSLKPLLDKLKSSLYQAEDILDNLQYKSLKKEIQDANSDSCKKVKKFVAAVSSSLTLKDKKSGMSKKDLKKSLENIQSAISGACKVLGQLNLPSVGTANGRPAVASNSRSAGIAAGHPLKVIGRDQDREKIIAMLHEKEDQCQANTISDSGYSVIGIHGMAGSGKSTLARLVYDHEKKQKEEKIEGHFDIVMWVHVSQKFTLDSILSQMLEGARQKVSPKFSSLNVLKESLQVELRGKRIFLVLDDVWYNNRNPEDREELRKLISPLDVGREGSRILVTSRTEPALVALGAQRSIPLSDLGDEVFLEMFKHYALRDARVCDDDRRILETIAEDIAKKLKRSPLAARTVGSRLCDNPTIPFWRSEKNRNLLDSTMGALWWSYQYLDEQVRRCFAYCSIFPRGHRLKRDVLVKLWVAEGFIKISKPGEDMEDVAQSYFDELLSASFLQLGGQEISDDSDSLGRIVDYFTIHDLLCDLAEEVAGNDCFRIEKGCTREVPPDVRYLFVRAYDREMLDKNESKFEKLRTLIIDEDIEDESAECKVIVSMFTKLMGLKKLRVLNLGITGGPITGSGPRTFSFPESIGQLKHLRYFAFRVGNTKLTIPGAFTKLYHIQVVDFGVCPNLVFSSGEDMINLVNLRRIISMTNLNFPNIGRLTWLRMLPFFTVKKEQGYESIQLKHLSNLEGILRIKGLVNVESKEEALEINLAGKEKLTQLVLIWDGGSCSHEVQEKVLEGLCPSKYLETLAIMKYQGMTLPNWMTNVHNGGPENLQELLFNGLSQLRLAPDLGAFKHLRSLSIFSCSWDALPGMEHLTSLKKLLVIDCMNMRSLATLPKSLEEFRVEACESNFKQLCDDSWSKSRKD